MSKDCKVSSRNSKKRVMHCQSAVPSCNDSVHECHLSNKMYYATRTVYSNNLCNGTSSNWKADWARFTGKSYAQVVGSNLTTVKSQQVSSNTTNSLAVKLKTCKAKSMEQHTFLTQKEGVHHNSSTGKQKPFRNYPNTITTHSSDFQLPLQNRFESVYLLDQIYPAKETSGKFDTNSKHKIHVKSPVHKVSAGCRKVSSDNEHYWQSADNSVKVLQSDTPN